MKRFLILALFLSGCNPYEAWNLARTECLDIAIPVRVNHQVCPSTEHAGRVEVSGEHAVLLCTCMKTKKDPGPMAGVWL